MSYKLSPEEIRKRIKKIAITPLESEIIKLIEEATGEKLPEPFDESKVMHGSVWRNGAGVTVVLVKQAHTDSETPIRAVIVEHDTFGQGAWFSETSRTEALQSLRRCGYTYLGQYDFAAGLPKGAN